MPYINGQFVRGSILGMRPYGWLFQLLILIAFFLVVYWIMKGSKSVKESALDILKRRYANGEITKKEFEKIKKDIE